MSLTFRAATDGDAERLSIAIIDGIAGYRSFAPEGWSPPSLAHEIERLTELIADETVWTLVAEQDGELAGQITIVPAAIAGRPLADPEMTHLRNLFVAESHWGTGLAKELHDSGIAESRARGFTQMRLFSAAGQSRARRFYEREGWLTEGEEFFEPPLGLVLIEYRLTL